MPSRGVASRWLPITRLPDLVMKHRSVARATESQVM